MANHTTISTATYRVQLLPHLDLWMRGARFGEVLREYNGKAGRMVLVKLDHPQIRKPVRLKAEDVRVIE